MYRLIPPSEDYSSVISYRNICAQNRAEVGLLVTVGLGLYTVPRFRDTTGYHNRLHRVNGVLRLRLVIRRAAICPLKDSRHLPGELLSPGE